MSQPYSGQSFAARESSALQIDLLPRPDGERIAMLSRSPIGTRHRERLVPGADHGTSPLENEHREEASAQCQLLPRMLVRNGEQAGQPARIFPVRDFRMEQLENMPAPRLEAELESVPQRVKVALLRRELVAELF